MLGKRPSFVTLREVSAVVSEMNAPNLELTSETVLCHEHVVEFVMKAHTVLPVRFSTVLGSVHNVKEFLMKQLVEVSRNNLNKYGEELCGDWSKIVMTPQSFFVVLSDGLGSGVKANIMATLTTEIAASMIEKGDSIDEVMETLIDTLPECKVRRLAYATFAILQVYHGRKARLVEYDSPPLIMIRNNEIVDLPMRERQISGRTIREGQFTLEEGDYLVMLSDGYIHAGVGCFYKMGWGWENIALTVKRWVATQGDAYQLARDLSQVCLNLYNGMPGDDSTIVAMKVRQLCDATVMTGPPSKPELDNVAMKKLMSAAGKKIICGGTTAQIIARELGQKLAVNWIPPSKRPSSSQPSKIPPMAHLHGVDLVTEGVLTLSFAAELLQKAETIHDIPLSQDADMQLARILLAADKIHFIVGDAINAHQLADVVRGKPMRQLYLEEVIQQLKRLNKLVTVEHL